MHQLKRIGKRNKKTEQRLNTAIRSTRTRAAENNLQQPFCSRFKPLTGVETLETTMNCQSSGRLEDTELDKTILILGVPV
ncbi:hypothetical protein PoB_003692000 [Plakobranchus ocellatus]|uniref:Uncharacterized protein n=1 Tax=Plakobranchus ocellatus TaxID=259542 RepID=A0AAV4ASX2_9GAST|nr:hypothetical protein PoB_003692000 [Plakobranchus ocellatus]